MKILRCLWKNYFDQKETDQLGNREPQRQWVQCDPSPLQGHVAYPMPWNHLEDKAANSSRGSWDSTSFTPARFSPSDFPSSVHSLPGLLVAYAASVLSPSACFFLNLAWLPCPFTSLLKFNSTFSFLNILFKIQPTGTSLVGQWLRFCASNEGGMNLLTDWGTKIPHAVQPKNKTASNESGTQNMLIACEMARHYPGT